MYCNYVHAFAYFSTDMASSGEQAPPIHLTSSDIMVMIDPPMETAVDCSTKNRATVQFGKKTYYACMYMYINIHVHVYVPV